MKQWLQKHYHRYMLRPILYRTIACVLGGVVLAMTMLFALVACDGSNGVTDDKAPAGKKDEYRLRLSMAK